MDALVEHGDEELDDHAHNLLRRVGLNVSDDTPITALTYIDQKRVELARALATGISGGATFAIAMQIAEKAESGSVILCMLPDTSERYLSSPLFESLLRSPSPRRITSGCPR